MARARVYLKSTKQDGRAVWGIDYTTANGRRVRRAVGNKRAAEAALAKALLEEAQRTPEESRRRGSTDLTLAQLAERWEAHAQRKGKVTWKDDRPKILRLARYVGGADRRVSSLTVDDVETMRRKLEREGLSAGGRNRQLYVLRAALRLAQRSGWVDWVPAVPAEREPPPRDVLWTEEAFTAVFERCPPSMRTMMLLGRGCALRLSEARLMTWDRVFLDDAAGPWLRVGSEAKTQKSKGRHVPIPPELAEHLRAIRPESPDPGTLVCPFEKTGEAWKKDSASSCIRQHVRRAGLGDSGLNFHALRHTRLTEIGKRTRNEIALADYAGHGSLTTTRKYVHRRANDIRASLGID